MRKHSRFARNQRLAIVTGILCIVLIIVALQAWLLAASLNAYLGGDSSVLLPAAIVSLIGLGLNAGLVWHILALER